jgi:integrase
MMDSFRDTAYGGFASMLFDPGRGINLRLNTELLLLWTKSISSVPDHGGSMLELTHYVPGKSNPVIARRRPGNKGRRYPADPPRVEEIVAVMRQGGTDPYGRRLRGLIIVLWRAGLRISEALALTESDVGGHPRVGARPPG